MCWNINNSVKISVLVPNTGEDIKVLVSMPFLNHTKNTVRLIKLHTSQSLILHLFFYCLRIDFNTLIVNLLSRVQTKINSGSIDGHNSSILVILVTIGVNRWVIFFKKTRANTLPNLPRPNATMGLFILKHLARFLL